LSRGAKRILFMEKDKAAIKTLKTNIAQTDANACEVFEGNSFETISQVKKRLKVLDASAFFYIDPPFSFREGMETIYDQTLGLIASLPLEMATLITIEHMSTLELPESIGAFKRIKSKKFGNTTLTYYA